MKIKLSRYAGFCFGVRRAIALVEDTLKREEKVYSLGPIIHNPQVVERLSAKGLKVIEPEELGRLSGGISVIRTHGIRKPLLERIKEKKIDIIDATCPFVKSAQRTCELLKSQDYHIIIVGESTHPEVQSLVSFSGSNVNVINEVSALKKRKIIKKKVGVVAQTTQSVEKFRQIIDCLLKTESEILELRVFNTICKDTTKRQIEAEELAKAVDVMVVLGGKLSANTLRLYRICKACQKSTYHIEQGSDIKASWFKKCRAVGITTGASTPDWLVEEVVKKIKKGF